MTGKKGRSGSGGPRPGAGRPPSTLTIQMPPVVLAQLKAIAVEQQQPVEEVVKYLLLGFIEAWQVDHTAESTN